MQDDAQGRAGIVGAWMPMTCWRT